MRRIVARVLGTAALLGVLAAPAVADSRSSGTAHTSLGVIAADAKQSPISAAPSILGTCPRGKPKGWQAGNQLSATREPSCREHELYDPFFSGCEPSLDNPAPICPPVAGPGGCRCAPGYIRESNSPGAKCVPIVPTVLEAKTPVTRTTEPA